MELAERLADEFIEVRPPGFFLASSTAIALFCQPVNRPSILITMTDIVSTRLVTMADDELLFGVYCSTRADEVAGFGWEQGAIDAFLRMQFDARQIAYKLRYAKCENAIVLFDGREVGSVIIERDDDEISLVDIAILPEFRGKGLATEIIRGLQEDAVGSGKSVTLRVDKQNMRAAALYERLGFTLVSESDLMFAMHWLPIRGESDVD